MGKTAHAATARAKVNTGDSRKIKLLAVLGIIDSFTKSFSPSARA
jgi:hypothetical protein